jgi:hypothetical protein
MLVVSSSCPTIAFLSFGGRELMKVATVSSEVGIVIGLGGG